MADCRLSGLQRRRPLRWRGSFEICARHVAELLLGGRELALVGRVALGVGGHVAVGAVGAQVVLVLATSSWGWKSLVVLFAALLCSSRLRLTRVVIVIGRY